MAMENEVRLLGPDGQPVRKQELTREVGRPTLTGVRQVWHGETIASGLTPQRLAALLRSTAEGSQRNYLTLAEEMKERDTHYAAVLGVRKRAVSGIEPAVEAASDDAADQKLADAVRDLIRKPPFGEMLDDSLDALGKGYSAVEIIWDRSASEWRPARYEWRDPRFFVFDLEDGRTLRLLDEADSYRGVALAPYKWIVHVPRLKSGLPLRGGLARLVALAYMVKAYAITDWTAFAEVFGMPLRLGRYGPNATEDDIRTLISAVANLGTDAAAVLPDTMRIDFTEPGNRTGGGGLFERLAVYLDKQVSKAVLGQTMTSDDGSSRAQAQVHDAVRGDILRSDARQLANTLNRDLVRPFIDLNHGPQKQYPRLLLPLNEPEDIAALVNALAKLVPMGLKVEASVIRDKLGLPDPEAGADVLVSPAQADPQNAANRRGGRIATNRSSLVPLEELAEESAADWEPQLSPLLKAIQESADRAGSYEEFQRGLAALLAEMDSSPFAERLALAAFQARGLGDAED